MRQTWNLRVIPGGALALLVAAGVAAGTAAEPERPVAVTAGEDVGDGSEDGSAPAESATGETSPTAVPQAGMRVFLDPVSGALKPAGPAREGEEQRRPSPGERLNTYGGDLLQEPLDEGGFRVDLRGRFRSSVVATIDPETDEVRIDCRRPQSAGESTATAEVEDDR